MEEDLKDLAGGDGVSVHAGFPNPALDRRGPGPRLSLDLNQLVIQNPSSTYLFRIAGHQWSDQGVYDGDVAVVDRATRRQPGDLVIAWQTSGFVICRQRQLTAKVEIWGVITAIIHQFAREE